MTSPPKDSERAGPRAGRPGMDYIKLTMGLLHPGAEIAVRRRPMRQSGLQWSILPTRSAPRILVPTRPRAASIRAIEGLGRPDARGALQRMALMAARVGGLAFAPRIVISSGSLGGIESALSSILDQSVVVSMAVGPERALQKPVLTVIGERGDVVAFVKVGVSDITRSLVDHEARVLTFLAERKLKTVRVPKVLAHEIWHGLSLLVQEPLEQGPLPTSRQVHAAAMEISALCQERVTSLTESEVWQNMVARANLLPPSSTSAKLVDVIDELESSGAHCLVGSGKWHGDFAPWNMGSDGHRLLVWDWEGYNGPVPLGVDLLHHHFQTSVVFNNIHPRVAAAGLASAAPDLLSSWPTQEAQLVVAVYFLLLAVAAVESGDAHARISRLDDWFWAAMRNQLDQIGRLQ